MDEFIYTEGDPELARIRMAMYTKQRVQISGRWYRVVSINTLHRKGYFPKPVKVVLQ